MKSAGIIASFCILCWAAVSCREVPNGSVMVDTNPSGWLRGDTVRLCYANADSVGLREILFTARIERRGITDEESLLPMWVGCTAPSGEHCGFDVAFNAAGVKQSGSMYAISCPMINDATLSLVGDYIFEFVPRTDLFGVWAVGVDIDYGKR